MANQLPEPRPPQPKDFGLTEQRIEQLQKGGRRRCFWSAVIPIFIVAVAMCSSRTSSGGEALLMALWITIFPGLFIAAPIRALLERQWLASQPDAEAFRQYGRAKVEYQEAYAAWLKTQYSWWEKLSPTGFETEVAANLRSRGYQVVCTGRKGDGGVDIRATAPNGTPIVVQCKAYRRPVGPGAVRELYGTMLHDGAKEGWLIALSGFSDASRQFAHNKPLRLLDVKTLIQRRGQL